MDAKKAAEVLLTTCSGCRPDENILIVTDPACMDIAMVMWEAAARFPKRSLILIGETGMHGRDPVELAGAAMDRADVIFGCTTFSLFHAGAKKAACAKGARFVNMVDYSPEMLEKGGLFCDFEAVGRVCKRIADELDGKDRVHITADTGTDFTCSIKGRGPTPQYGRSLSPGASSSPPNIECATCAVEGTPEGVVYIDGSIPHPELGLIREPIRLTVQSGEITGIDGGHQADILARVLREFNDPNVYKIGEIGLGLNPMCALSGRMLEDEGCSGTVHLGCGDNTGFGGVTESAIHLDVVFDNPTLVADGVRILDRGAVVLD